MMASDEKDASVADRFRGILSDRAVRELERKRLLRDPSKTCDGETLRAMLVERGLPVYQSVLDFEGRCGGIPEGSGSYFGLFSVIRQMEGAHGEHTRRRLEEDDLVSFDGRLLLPISSGRTGENWIDEKGAVYDGSAEVGECSPKAASYISFFEQRALRSEWEETPSERRTFVVKASTGAEIAAALSFPPYGPATDAFGAWWVNGAEWVIDRIEPYGYPRRETLVHVDSMDATVLAMQAVLEKEPQALIDWYGPNGPPPAEGESVAARLGWYEYREKEAVGEVLFIGTPGSYRVHRYFYEKFSRYDHGGFVWAGYGKPSAEFPSPADWPGRQRPYEFSASVRVGAAVARALGALPVELACDSGESAWARDGIEIKENVPRADSPKDYPLTRVSVPTIEDVIRGMEATLAAEPRAPLWWDSDNRMPPEEGEPVARSFPTYHADGRVAGEILIIGTPGNYRVHSRWIRNGDKARS